MQQVIVDFGVLHVFDRDIPVRIYGYGLMLVLGFLLGIYLARWRARRFGEDPDVVTNLGLLALIGGVVGARLAFVMERWNSFADARDPLAEVFNITSGGLIYYGGVALASILVVLYLLARRLPVRRYLDVIAPSLMVGLGFGRLGCLLNGCCFGGACTPDFKLGMTFPYASKPLLVAGKPPNVFAGATASPVYYHQFTEGRVLPPEELMHTGSTGVPPVSGNAAATGETPVLRLKSPAELGEDGVEAALHEHSLPVKPAQALSAADAFLLACLLWAFSRLRQREGQVFVLLLLLYPPLRFLEEIIRGDNPHDLLALKFTHNQYTSGAMLLAGIALWIYVRHVPGVAPFWKDRLAAKSGPAPAEGHRSPKKGRR